jgi:hypothetical protein
MQIAACQKRRPAYRHSTNTVADSSSATEKVTVVSNHLLSIAGSSGRDGWMG